MDMPLLLFLRECTLDDVTTIPILVGYVISICATEVAQRVAFNTKTSLTK